MARLASSVMGVVVFLLEALFIAGWIGSIFVVMISGVEDLKTIFSRDDGAEKHGPIAS
jgi:hypothetical protein